MNTTNQNVSRQKDFDSLTAKQILKAVYHQIRQEISQNETVKTSFIKNDESSQLSFMLNGSTISVNIQEGGLK